LSWNVILYNPNELNEDGYCSQAPLCSSSKIQEGGTQIMGGTNECDLNITYNYSRLYHLVFPVEHVQDSDGVLRVESTGLKWLYGKTGETAIPILEKAVERLGTNQYERTVDNCNKCGFTCGVGDGLSDPWAECNRRRDYWAPTPGNAGYALNILLEWAREFPKGVFTIY